MNPDETWWVINGAELQAALRRVSAGDDPDLAYIELHANTRPGEMMDQPIAPPAGQTSHPPCKSCGGEVTMRSVNTESLQDYGDGQVPGPPNDPRRLVLRPDIRMVPGRTTVTVQPCGHRWIAE